MSPTGTLQDRIAIVTGRPEEIAAMVAHVFGEASFRTGITFPVDGGWAAKGSF